MKIKSLKIVNAEQNVFAISDLEGATNYGCTKMKILDALGQKQTETENAL